MKKLTTPRRTRGETADADPYKPARRPARTPTAERPARAEGPVRGDRPLRAADRGKRPVRTFDRAQRPARSFDRGERPPRSFERSERPPRSFDRGERPVRSTRPPREGGAAPRYGARRFAGDDRGASRVERGPSAPRTGGFTVNLDPDVARIFRGDASVNKALRLVMQLMQVVQGPPPREGAEGGARFGGDRPPRPTGYRGSAEARGFERKPKFEEGDEN